ncbi:MAG: ribonuclease III [Anaerolineae bacterium]|nr:ribonuclease III [Anaerolineae bacterium]
MNEAWDLEQRIGIVFQDKSLLKRALTHRSYLNEHPEFPFEDNERLEFLGDAVIDFLSGEYLYHRFPELPEGPLTSLRSTLVRRETLASFAQDLRLGQYLLMGYGEAESGGRKRSTVLADAFEALAGAVYLDQGLEALQRFFQPFMEEKVAEALRDETNKDPKSRLQELAQSEMHNTPRYVTISESGPDHAKEFTVQVTIGGRAYGRGAGPNKQLAAQAAAQAALEQIGIERVDGLNGGDE